MSGKRSLLTGLAVGALIVAFSGPLAAADVRELHVMDAGGQWGDAMAKCVDEPLLKEKGIKVVTETPGGYAKLVAQAKSGTVVNAASDGATTELVRLAAEGLIEKIDWAAVNPEPMFPEAKNDYGFGTSYYSTIMAFRADAKPPKNWTDFFDTVNFPGKRALPDYPDYVLPFADLADGMTAAEVAKGLDLDRAFKVLERVKKDTIWWTAGAQPPQLLKDNEAQYAISWSGRVVGQEGIKVNWQDGMLDMSWFFVAKGASKEQKEMLWQWFHDQTVASKQACVAQYISYPGPSPDLEKLLPKDKLDQFPTYSENKKIQWFTDGKWWVEHSAEIEKRWSEFKLKQ
jgi:putative spermidine/putrescine transport system substrate-binding protein